MPSTWKVLGVSGLDHRQRTSQAWLGSTAYLRSVQSRLHDATMTRMRTSLGWLHLTDLHQGMGDQSWLWPSLREEFLEDLARVHDRAGPWDVVLFTGDLTQRGSVEEFRHLDENLARLWDRFEQLGSTPGLLAVPGNHDLVRPGQPRAVHVLLMDWATKPDIQKQLWDDPRSEFQQALLDVFAPYQEWWERRRNTLPSAWEIQEGKLPGDWAVTIPVGERSVGIVGLNSSYVQLDGGNYKGRIVVDVRQFQAACCGDGADWAGARDFCLLLTHHPTNWLHATSQDRLRSEIDKPGRFFAHLQGHMHEAAMYSLSEGGGKPRRQWQGRSLFGLEAFGEDIQRSHGYAAGRVEFKEDTAQVRVWPRSARKTKAGVWRLGVDNEMEVLEDNATPVEVIAIRPRKAAAKTAPNVQTFEALQRPGLTYDLRWHVVREEEEEAVDSLLTSGEPVSVCAPMHFGKTWFVDRVLELVKQREPDLPIAKVDFDVIDTSSLSRILEAIAQSIAQAAGIEQLTWPAMGTDQGRFLEALSQKVRPRVHDRLILALDIPNDLVIFPERDGLSRALRAISGQGDKSRFAWLRVILAISTSPALLGDIMGSPWSVPEILLEEFEDRQILDLAKSHGLAWGDQELDCLRASIGGHPYMVRSTMHEVVRSGQPLARSLDNDGVRFHLRRIEQMLVRDTALSSALCAVVGGHAAGPDLIRRLEQAGVLRHVSGTRRYALRFPIYHRIVDRLCL